MIDDMINCWLCYCLIMLEGNHIPFLNNLVFVYQYIWKSKIKTVSNVMLQKKIMKIWFNSDCQYNRERLDLIKTYMTDL